MQHKLSQDAPRTLSEELAALQNLNVKVLQQRWRALYGTEPPVRISAALLFQAVAYRLQEQALGGIKSSTRRLLERVAEEREGRQTVPAPAIKARPAHHDKQRVDVIFRQRTHIHLRQHPALLIGQPVTRQIPLRIVLELRSKQRLAERYSRLPPLAF